MPESASPASAVLEELGFVLFERDSAGVLRLAGRPPPWLSRLWPALDSSGAGLAAAPFLENFLIDASEYWARPGGPGILSGPWIETDAEGTEVPLEATALSMDGRSILLLQRLASAFTDKQAILQKARETVIAYAKLDAEIQKKEILLHCIAEQLTAALGNIITSLRLIEMEAISPRTEHLVSLAMRGTQEQQRLIRTVLDLYDEELRQIYAGRGETGASADLRAVIGQAAQAVAPRFAEKAVRLDAEEIPAREFRVTAEAAHLERVVANLIENALDSTPPGSAVVLRLEAEPEFIQLSVEDAGPPLSPELRTHLFTAFELPPAHSRASWLRLHFCRITIESCHGEIGCTARPGGGNAFWIRLPAGPPHG